MSALNSQSWEQRPPPEHDTTRARVPPAGPGPTLSLTLSLTRYEEPPTPPSSCSRGPRKALPGKKKEYWIILLSSLKARAPHPLFHALPNQKGKICPHGVFSEESHLGFISSAANELESPSFWQTGGLHIFPVASSQYDFSLQACASSWRLLGMIY